MTKINRKLFLVVFNIGFAMFLGYLVFWLMFLTSSPLTFGASPASSLLTACLLFFLFLNLWSAFSLVHTKDGIEKNLRIYLLVTIHTVIWFFILLSGFLGYYFISNTIFPAVLVLFVIGDFFLLKGIFKKKVYLISLVTILIVTFTVLLEFEEGYCWGKGDEADPTGSKIVAATGIGVAWQAHMECHGNFNFSDALKEKYLLIK